MLLNLPILTEFLPVRKKCMILKQDYTFFVNTKPNAIHIHV